MKLKTILMEKQKKIALVAHDGKKDDLLEWAKNNKPSLVRHRIFATGTTGCLLEAELGIRVEQMMSGPLGGDLQIGAKIAEGKIDFIVFFWDPLEAQPHDPDVKALLRLAVLWNIPAATNRASADFMFSSPMMDGEYGRVVEDYEAFQKEREQQMKKEIKQTKKAAPIPGGER